MTECFIFAMASGQVGDELKFYFHSQLANQAGYALAEVVFKQSLGSLTGTLKITRPELADDMAKKIEHSLKPFTL